jgi:predicted DNA-binding protein (UPF0251 family)
VIYSLKIVTEPGFIGKRKKRSRELSLSLSESDYETIAAHCNDNLMGMKVQDWLRLLAAKEIEANSQSFRVQIPRQHLWAFIKNAQKAGFTPTGYLVEMAIQLAKQGA